jgi:hypothetical protein
MWTIALYGPPGPYCARVKKSVLNVTKSLVLLGGYKFLMYIRGRGLLREDPPSWDGIGKVWMF